MNKKVVMVAVFLLVVVGVGVVLVKSGKFEVAKPDYQYRLLEASDKIGRSVVVEDEKVAYHKGKGVVEVGGAEGKMDVVSITGRFAGWGVVEGSADRILKLRDIDTGEELPEVRLVFETSPLSQRLTQYRVIDLNKIESMVFDDSSTLVGPLATVGAVGLGKIIKVGDVVQADVDRSSGLGFKDESGRWVVDYVNLRRFGGARTLARELK